MQKQTLTVKQLNLYVRSLIEGDIKLADICVCGEISNFKNHYGSGHLYFTLKDNDAAIKCVMFRSFASRLKFVPEDGFKVILRGRVSLYEKDGSYQFYAEEMLPDGIGDIALAFEQIKEKLQKEGLFDIENKRPIPKFPKRIAVVTSETGAAVRDIINILSRRWPLAQIVLCPVSVQGESAVPDMIDALNRIYSLEGFDLLIIGRGGGSIEDLWAFNSEDLARKIYESPIPVISAVGHETDFTICDFVADLRAPTPSAAAELAVPAINDIERKISLWENQLKTILKGKLRIAEADFEKLINSYPFKNPYDAFIERNFEDIDRLSDRLISAADRLEEKKELEFSELLSKFDALSPLKVLSRGFTAVTKNEKSINNISEIRKGDTLKLRFSDGTALCMVEEIIDSAK